MKYKIKKFGDLKPGDVLVGSHGEVVVDKVYDKHIPERMYEIEMEDGSVVKSSGNHLWYCETEIDVRNKGEYIRLAKAFFANNDIPEKEEDLHLQKNEIITLFNGDVDTVLFIQNACDSLGHSSVQPHAILDGKHMRKEDFVAYEEIPLYSISDLIDFLHLTKKSLEGSGYLYFGKVRTTDEIFAIMENGKYVNVPSLDEIKE